MSRSKGEIEEVQKQEHNDTKRQSNQNLESFINTPNSMPSSELLPNESMKEEKNAKKILISEQRISV